MYLPREIETKSAALVYSIELATKRTDKGTAIIDYKKAQKNFDFINSNLSLPEVKVNPEGPLLAKCSQVLDTISEVLSDAIEARKIVKGTVAT